MTALAWLIPAALALGGSLEAAGLERCGFEHVAQAGGSEVRAFVFGSPDIVGSYRLAVEVVSAGGHSSVEQGGMFHIAEGANRAMVGLLGTQAASRTQLHISLSARAAGREVVCAVLIDESGAQLP